MYVLFLHSLTYYFYLRTIYVHKRSPLKLCSQKSEFARDSSVRLSSRVVTFRQSARTCTDTNERLRCLVHALANEIIFNHRSVRDGRFFWTFKKPPSHFLLAWARGAVVREESRCGSPVMCFGCSVLFLPSSSPSPLSILNLPAEWNRWITPVVDDARSGKSIGRQLANRDHETHAKCTHVQQTALLHNADNAFLQHMERREETHVVCLTDRATRNRAVSRFYHRD